jgi:hypothetical protein
MTSNKDRISQNVKGWLQINKEIQILQKELKDRKKKKEVFTKELLDIMKSNEIDCFDISEGKIIYTQSNIKKPINKQHLLECLSNYFEKNTEIPTDDIVKYILEKRESSIKENIRHKLTKNV